MTLLSLDTELEEIVSDGLAAGVDVAGDRIEIEVVDELAEKRAARAKLIAESAARQLEAENNINRPRLNRNQLRLQTAKDNPDLKQTDPMFIEAFVLNTMQQEQVQSIKVIAQFTGLSKGAVIGALSRVQLRIKAAQMEQASAAMGAEIEKRITEFKPEINDATEGQSDSEGTGDTADTDARRQGDDIGSVETVVEGLQPIDVPTSS